MATVWKWILAVTLVFMVLAPVTNKATANPTSQNTVQSEKVNTKTGSTQKTSQPGSSCCAEVSSRQQIPKLERSPFHNAGGKKTKKICTRRKSGKSKSRQRKNKQKTKRLSEEETAAKTVNKKVDEHLAQFIEFRKKLHSSFTYRADAIMNLLDALSGNTRVMILLDKLILPKKGKLSSVDQGIEYAEEFIQGRRQHSAVESAINALENHGLDRCPDNGIVRFKRYVALAVKSGGNWTGNPI